LTHAQATFHTNITHMTKAGYKISSNKLTTLKNSHALEYDNNDAT